MQMHFSRLGAWAPPSLSLTVRPPLRIPTDKAPLWHNGRLSYCCCTSRFLCSKLTLVFNGK